ncbi:hypothetical protein HYALB_00009652 [Hymenoscyphus albidus]|uniref:Uncharacterized protein n=1 Tax=Hymenoscyphus albidus TaxID=595503 RepID=A0A9N9LGF7_9HELO|nr:hypothetical protein HYALB_00009652 [Hymenoscyphus albidus]
MDGTLTGIMKCLSIQPPGSDPDIEWRDLSIPHVLDFWPHYIIAQYTSSNDFLSSSHERPRLDRSTFDKRSSDLRLLLWAMCRSQGWIAAPLIPSDSSNEKSFDIRGRAFAWKAAGVLDRKLCV